MMNAMLACVFKFRPAPIAQLEECPLRGTGGHGFDPVLAAPRLALRLTG